MVLQITASDAWKFLQEQSNSILVDVRTKEEIDFVGFADLSTINSKLIYLPLKFYPQMATDNEFTDKLTSLVEKTFPAIELPKINLLFMCRSGARSLEAAMLMSDFGYNCYNITNGFEGQVDSFGHRGCINGWKAEKLPWRQN